MKRSSHPMIFELEKLFLENASPKIAEGQAKYMKNLFPFLGIQKPQRAQIQRLIFKKYPIKDESTLFCILQILWCKNEREFQYTACDLAEKYLKLCSEKALNSFEKMIRNKSWWDTVDKISSNLLGILLLNYPKFISLMDRWIEDPNLWIRRSALLYQLKYKTQTNEKKLFEYCQKLMHEKEFFIQKAIDWALREYSKTSPETVKFFIRNHSLSPLSQREGMKIINK